MTKTMREGKFGIQINLDTTTNECSIGSTSGDAWTDIAVCLEGLSVICERCIENGMSPDKVYGEVDKYFIKAHDDYKIKREEN